MDTKTTHRKKKTRQFPRVLLTVTLITIILTVSAAVFPAMIFENINKNVIYPNVTIGGIPFGGKTVNEAKEYWEKQSRPFEKLVFEFTVENRIATLSGTEMQLGYDAPLSATQAYLVGRSGNIFTMTYQKFFAGPIDIKPMFTYDINLYDQILESLGDSVYITPVEPLFDFENGRVTEFKPARDGQALDKIRARREFLTFLGNLPDYAGETTIRMTLPVVTLKPSASTGSVNSFGIKERIGYGYSEFRGSIPSRIHNVALSASRFHGVLIAPGETVSYNRILGDVSAATGFQPAYIIKNGRTVLGDGGGVCQMSTTLFRAVLSAGLPITERQPHAYRVHYYEEGGFKAGLDATVFDPSVDLKFTNNTGHHILIQTRTDTKKLTLVVELYGTGDGRTATISNHKVWAVTPPPEPLYQDDPTLPAGQIRQVDWAAWGAKASFDYKVIRGDEILEDKSFFSNYRPWQAVYLKGTKI